MKKYLLYAMLVLAGLLAMPVMAEEVNLDTATYVTDADSSGGAVHTVVGAHTLTGVNVELLYGTFGVEDESQLLFVAVDSTGDIQLYCALTDTQFGGMPGEIVRLSDEQVTFLASDCVPGDAWRTSKAEQVTQNT